jgi:hypothetical protein
MAGIVISSPVQVEVPAELVTAPLVNVNPLRVVVDAAVVAGNFKESPVTLWAALVTVVERSMSCPVVAPAKVAVLYATLSNVPEVFLLLKLSRLADVIFVPVTVMAAALVPGVTVKVLSKDVAPCRVNAFGVVLEPMVLIDEAPDPNVLVSDEPVPRVVAPDEVRVVNAPVEVVVAPIAVELIPVAVVLKLDEVIVKALAPVLIDDTPKPDKVKAPEVPVIFTAPVVVVKPLLAVRVDEKRPDPVTSNVVPGAVFPIPTLPIWKLYCLLYPSMTFPLASPPCAG